MNQGLTWYRSLRLPLVLMGILFLMGIEGTANAGVVHITANQDGAKLYEILQRGNEGAMLKDRAFKEIREPWDIEMQEDQTRMLVMEKPGYLPVYIPLFQAPKNNQMTVQVDMKRIDGTTKTQLASPVAALADEMVDAVIYVQQLLDQKKYEEAMARAESLYVTHPRSLSVRLIYANALMGVQAFAQADSIYGELMQDAPESMQALKGALANMRQNFGRNLAKKSVQKARMPASKPANKPLRPKIMPANSKATR